MSGTEQKLGEGLQLEERQKTNKPPLYQVFLLNDDYTTMDFVVYVLESIFHRSPVEATEIMLLVHKKGVGLAGVYTRQVAETKIAAAHQLAQDNEFPLKCIMEKE